MRHTAKLFKNGRSQAVRLPAAFRFPGEEVTIRRDPQTGDVILSAKPPGDWEEFFQLHATMDFPEDFMNDRVKEPAQERDLF